MFELSEWGKSKCIMQFHNEDIFFADYTGRKNGKFVCEPGIHLLCPKLSSFGLKVEDIYFGAGNNWFKMESKNFQKNVELQRFTITNSSLLSMQICSLLRHQNRQHHRQLLLRDDGRRLDDRFLDSRN